MTRREMVTTAQSKRKRGRPPESESGETRERILAAARACFSRDGYGKTTNRDIAEAAGVTPAALYHYFDSKQDLFEAAYEEMLNAVFAALEEVGQATGSAVERMRAVLSETARINATDPSFATFVATAPLDMRRHTELAPLAVATFGRLRAFYGGLVAEGVVHGEVSADVAAERVVDMLIVLTSGLANFAAFVEDPVTQEGVTDALLRLFDGTLLDRG